MFDILAVCSFIEVRMQRCSLGAICSGFHIGFSHSLTCHSFCLAGAAGCVATLLHDAAMNPAEGEWTLPRVKGGSCSVNVTPCYLKVLLNYSTDT